MNFPALLSPRPRVAWTLPGLLTVALILVARTSAAQTSAAASDAAPMALPTVQSEMTRGTFLPYGRLNDLLLGLRTHGEGLFAPSLKLRAAKEYAALPEGFKLALMDDERTIPIPVAPDGSFDLPIFPPAEAKSMELGGNLRKGETSLVLSVDLTTPADQLDLRTVRRIVLVGQRLRAELLPWYVRWLFPQIDGVMACSDRPQWQLGWVEQGQRLVLPLQADADTRELYTPRGQASRPCTVLSGQENLPETARLEFPADGNTRLHIKLRLKRVE